MARSIDSELKVLERSVHVLRVDYERFFVGDLKQQPFAARRKVEEMLKRLANVEIERIDERYRLQMLQSRYTALGELWEKKLAWKDQGRLGPGGIRRERPAAEAAAAPAAGPVTPIPPDAANVSSVQKRRVDFTPLFQRYVAAREAAGEDVTKLRYERFEELVRRQAEEIKKKTGNTRLVFEIQTVDGKVKLVGRPAGSRGA